MRERHAMLTAVFDAATAPAEVPVPGEDAALAAFREVMALDRTAPGEPVRRSMKSRTKILVASGAVSALTLLGGGAAAATGTLPDSAADAARAALARVGLAGPSEHAGDHPADSATTHTKSATGAQHSAAKPSATASATPTETGAVTESTAAADPAANDHGKLVSQTARGDYESGREHGEAVSSVAASKSAEHRRDEQATAKRAELTPTPTPTPTDTP